MPRRTRSPNAFIGTRRRKFLGHLLITGPRHPAVVLNKYLEHYNTHRPHRSRPARRPHSLRPPEQASGRCNETVSEGLVQSTHRSRDVTEFSTRTRLGNESRSTSRTPPSGSCRELDRHVASSPTSTPPPGVPRAAVPLRMPPLQSRCTDRGHLPSGRPQRQGGHRTGRLCAYGYTATSCARCSRSAPRRRTRCSVSVRSRSRSVSDSAAPIPG
jgi:hypothetical protein